MANTLLKIKDVYQTIVYINASNIGTFLQKEHEHWTTMTLLDGNTLQLATTPDDISRALTESFFMLKTVEDL